MIIIMRTDRCGGGWPGAILDNIGIAAAVTYVQFATIILVQYIS